MLFATLKIVHFLALLLGGAASIAPGLMRKSLARTGHDGPPPPAIGMTMRVLGILGLVAIILLWLTGGAMMSMAHDWGAMALWFWIKLLAATAILGTSVYMNLAVSRAARGGPPPSPALVKTSTTVIRTALVLAIICAVLTFA